MAAFVLLRYLLHRVHFIENGVALLGQRFFEDLELAAARNTVLVTFKHAKTKFTAALPETERHSPLGEAQCRAQPPVSAEIIVRKLRRRV